MKISVLCLSLLAAGALASAAEITLPRVSIAAGSTASGNVQFAAQGAQVAGMQFDVEYPASLSLTATLGGVASAAGKSLTVQDMGAGRKRLLIVGINQTVIADGTVAVLAITVQAGTGPGVYDLRVSGAAAANPSAGLLPLAGVNGAVTVGTPQTLPTTGAFAQVASGGTWKTSFTLFNTGTAPAPVRLRFWNDSGGALDVPLTSSQTPGQAAVTTSTAEWTIPSLGSLLVETEAPTPGPTLVGWAELQTSGEVLGHAIFSQRVQADRLAEAVVQFASRNRTSYLLPFDETPGYVTGVALANLSSAAVTITAVLRDDSGAQISGDSIALPAYGHTSYEVSSRLPGIRGRRGTLEFRSTSGNIAVLGLRFNQFSSFATIPAASR
jgi:hypothetical protein